MNIKKIAVIGAGTMGNGIAHVFAMNEFPVTLVDISQDALNRAVGNIEKNLGRMVRKEKLTESQANDTLKRITTSTKLEEAVSGCGLVVEAVNENLDLKRDILEKADRNAPESAVIASNTSSISITKLAAFTNRPDQFVGMHFFNPVPVMALVEVIRGLETSDNTVKTVMEAARALGKNPVEVNDSPGFVSNRVLMPMINEAIFTVYEGVGTPEAIDEVMKLGMAHPMGPLRLADFIGLDVCLNILNVLYDGFRDPKYRPCPLLVKMVDAGKLGDKSGEGFYKYN